MSYFFIYFSDLNTIYGKYVRINESLENSIKIEMKQNNVSGNTAYGLSS